MEYRLGREQLLNIMVEWNRFLKHRVHLIACGGTAMTLLGVKPSTKDIDYMIPNAKEYAYLIKQLSALGYKQTPDRGGKGIKRYFDLTFFAVIIFIPQSYLVRLWRTAKHRPERIFTSLYWYFKRL
jgi:hypothetical protein